MQDKRRLWLACVLEAAGLFGFIVVAGTLSIALEHPGMPGQQGALRYYPLLRRLLLGAGIGLYTFGAVKLLSKRTGAHMNPAVTFAFWTLGTMRTRDMLAYVGAQFAGALTASFLLKATLRKWFSHPSIHYGATIPQPPHGSIGAFLGEFGISALLMAAILVTTSSRKLEPKGAMVTALLLVAFLTFELPFSGMSMNPARSFSGDAAAGDWAHLWIYFAAPVSAMLLMARLYPVWLSYKARKTDLEADHRALPCSPSEAPSAE